MARSIKKQATRLARPGRLRKWSAIWNKGSPMAGPPVQVNTWSLIEEISRHSAKYSQIRDPPAEKRNAVEGLRRLLRAQL